MLFKSGKNQKIQIIKDKLLSLNYSDPAINTKKSRSDLIDLDKYVEKKLLLNFLWSNETTLTFEDGDITAEMQNRIHELKDIEEYYDFCEDYNINIDKNTISKPKNIETLKKELITSLRKTSFKVAELISTLYKKAIKIENCEGISSFYIASYFLNGIDKNDKTINAPLLLWEIEFENKNNKIYLTKKYPYPTINEKLNFYLKHEYKLDIELSNVQNNEKILDEFGEYEKRLNKIMTKSEINQKKIVEFIETTNKPFQIINAAVLTLVEPLGGCIKHDIQVIEKNKEDPFKINTKTASQHKCEEVIADKDELIETNCNLNIYQKYAIQSALTDNTLIYGPPGTGKSETVTAIIANVVNANKNVLISSEKKEALEVLQKRMGSLGSLALFGYQNDKASFYEHLQQYEQMIRKVWKEQDLLDAHDEYVRIKDMYYWHNVSFSGKDPEFWNFTKAASLINLDQYLEYQKAEFFDSFNSIMKKQKLDFDGTLEFMSLLRQKTAEHNSQLLFILSHSSFNSFDSDFFKKFLKKYEKNPDDEYLISSLIMKNRIATKKSLFASRKLLVNLDNQKIVELLRILSGLNLNNLTNPEINLILSFNFEYAETFKHFMVFDNWYKKISKQNKLQTKQSIDTLFKAYIQKRQLSASKNADIILHNILKKVIAKLNQMSQEEQENMFEMFTKCALKNKMEITFFIKKYYEQLRFFFPIWILIPEQVCMTCPIEKNIFDYGIFDEASQMFLEKSYPLVYRCKINVVAGDDKQLQPSNFFTKKIEQEDEFESISDSLFEMCKICLWPSFYLKNHYRSKSADLISFSNQYFYEDQLEFSTYNGSNLHPIEVHNVKGVWENNCNLIEVNKIISLFKENKDEFLHKSIICVTFNSIQQKLLLSTFVNELGNTKLYHRYLDGYISFKSLENVQGDEADIVIFSISYAKKKDGTFHQFFGPLSQAYGANRLNVAITRAKEKMIVVKSIDHQTIKTSDNKSNNIFKSFLQFIDNVNENTNEKPKTKQENINEEQFYIQPVVDVISTAINPNVYEIKTNYAIGKKTIDIAIINKNNDLVQFGIVIDKNNQSRTFKEYIESLDSFQFLKDLNYNIYYLNLFDWYARRDLVLKEIVSKMPHN